MIGRRLLIGAAAALALAVAAGCASKSEVEALRKEVEALKVTQAALVAKLGGSNGAAAAQTQRQRPALPASIDLTGFPFKGSPSARVALVEFSDYECPYCIRHFQQTMPEIQRTYIDTNKIRYVFRDFPIDELHPESIRAHVASHCAAEQNKFWEMHDRLFSAPGSHKPEQLKERAREAGLNAAAFDACVAADKYSAAIRKSTAYAFTLGASGTPFFVVGKFDPSTNQLTPTQAIYGAYPFANFQQVIEGALK
jgi:protein-disulfide isomerase